MSISPMLPIAKTPAERRQSDRFRPSQPIETIVGRGSGRLVDISATGARIRHTASIARGAHVRITFDWQGQRFEAVGEVLASRVAGISNGGTQFESRVRFLPLAPAASAVLESVFAEIGRRELREWVANLNGWTPEDPVPHPARPSASTFVRCRFVGGRWEQRGANKPGAPADGFTVAGGTDPSEIRALCRTWEQSDAEGRRLLQLMTSAVLQEITS